MKAQYFAVIGTDNSDIYNFVPCETMRMAQDIQTHGTVETDQPCSSAEVMYSMMFAELGVYQTESA